MGGRGFRKADVCVLALTMSMCTNIEKYAVGQHHNNMVKYANTIRVLVTHVSYTELHEHAQFAFIRYSSVPELRRLSSRYSLYETPVEICQPIQFAHLYTSE